MRLFTFRMNIVAHCIVHVVQNMFTYPKLKTCYKFFIRKRIEYVRFFDAVICSSIVCHLDWFQTRCVCSHCHLASVLVNSIHPWATNHEIECRGVDNACNLPQVSIYYFDKYLKLQSVSIYLLTSWNHCNRVHTNIEFPMVLVHYKHFPIKAIRPEAIDNMSRFCSNMLEIITVL